MTYQKKVKNTSFFMNMVSFEMIKSLYITSLIENLNAYILSISLFETKNMMKHTSS